MLATKHKILIARTLSRIIVGLHATLGRSPMITTRRGGIRWRLDLREGIDLAIYLLGGFEVRTLRQYARLVKHGDVVLDIGANIGAHSLPLARLVGPHGRVISFEPTAYAHGKQVANIALNPDLAPRINARQMLLVGTRQASLPDAICASWPMERASDLDHQHGGRRMPTDGAACATLDDLLEAEGIRRVDLVKLDVDGNELDVLLGASKMLRTLRPPLMLELAPFVHHDDPSRFDGLISLLDAAGYRLQEVATARPLPLEVAALRSRIPEGGGINVLALPAMAADRTVA